MMGQLAANQNALFYNFNLEQRIPDNHLLRKIDQFLDSIDSPNTYIPIIWLDRQRTTEYPDTRIYD